MFFAEFGNSGSAKESQCIQFLEIWQSVYFDEVYPLCVAILIGPHSSPYQQQELIPTNKLFLLILQRLLKNIITERYICLISF